VYPGNILVRAILQHNLSWLYDFQGAQRCNRGTKVGGNLAAHEGHKAAHFEPRQSRHSYANVLTLLCCSSVLGLIQNYFQLR